MDGQLRKCATGLKSGRVIPQGGTVVFGQDQDSLGGGFGKSDAFGPGQLADLNMWCRVLSGDEIAIHFQECRIPQGFVHVWSQFKDVTHGAVRVE